MPLNVSHQVAGALNRKRMSSPLVSILVLSLTFIGISIMGCYSRRRTIVNGLNQNGTLRYGIVVDCGSSGSRVYVYYWRPLLDPDNGLVSIHQLTNGSGKPVVKKLSPGLSEYVNNSSGATGHIGELLRFVAGHIPVKKHRTTVLYILATAGMRVLPKQAQVDIMSDLYHDIPNEFDFIVEECNLEVISGKDEGIYAWIAVNYALKRFSRDLRASRDSVQVQLADGFTLHRRGTVGMIDLGGGSVQMAFEVTHKNQLSKIPKDLLVEIYLGNQETDIEYTYMLYVTTFLGYGANSAIRRHHDLLLEGSSMPESRLTRKPKAPVLDPCLPPGMMWTVDGGGQSLEGTGDYDLCRRSLEPLLRQSAPCTVEPCSMDGVHQPEVNFSSSQFYGFSEFWYTMEDIFDVGGPYDHDTFDALAHDFCHTSWPEVAPRFGRNLQLEPDDQRLRFQCFKSAWMTTLLHKGFHFPVHFSHFQSADQVNGSDVQWTLGALFYRSRWLLYHRDVLGLTINTAAVLPWIHGHVLPEVYIMLLCSLVVLGLVYSHSRHVFGKSVCSCLTLSFRSLPVVTQ